MTLPPLCMIVHGEPRAKLLFDQRNTEKHAYTMHQRLRFSLDIFTAAHFNIAPTDGYKPAFSVAGLANHTAKLTCQHC